MVTTLNGERPADVAGSRLHVRVLADRCAGCQECVIRCPTGALTMDHARWVAAADDDLCVGCRQCVRTCPFSAVVVEGPPLTAPRVETEVLHPSPLAGDITEVRAGIDSWEAALAEAGRCLSCPDPTCVRGCPAHNDVPGFIAALRRRDLPRAHEILRRTSVLPDACARVCNQAAQCEGACTWSLAGDVPVAIGQLERFVTERCPVPGPAVRTPAGTAEASAGSGEPSVAIVGSGPAGIGAAWSLLEAGAAVTVYERDPSPGGLLGWGIPDFTLPQEVADRSWRQLVAAGVDLRCGVEIDAAGIDRLLEGHDAVVVAAGAGMPLRLPVPGAELEGVTDATVFLTSARAALGSAAGEAWRAGLGLPEKGAGRDAAASRVLVLGAGNTAMDVARTARRLGLEATCVDWLDERYALARPDELAEARAEGVDIRFARTVTRLEGDGTRVRCALLARTQQPSGDRPPQVLHGEPAEVVEVGLVVMAMGYRVDPALGAVLPGTPVRRAAQGLPDRRWVASGILASPAPAFANRQRVGQLALDREAGVQVAALPVRDRLWVVGDALVGPSTVVEAMAQGARAASAIMAFRPIAPGNPERDRVPRVLVCYASSGGRTAHAAHAIGTRLGVAGLRVRVLPLERVGLAELASADVLVVGTWVEGLVVTGVRPARATREWLARLPRLAGKATALFCTYAVDPRRSLDLLAASVRERGAEVVATAAFGRGDIVPDAERWADRVLAALPAAAPGRTAAEAGDARVSPSGR